MLILVAFVLILDESLLALSCNILLLFLTISDSNQGSLSLFFCDNFQTWNCRHLMRIEIMIVLWVSLVILWRFIIANLFLILLTGAEFPYSGLFVWLVVLFVWLWGLFHFTVLLFVVITVAICFGVVVVLLWLLIGLFIIFGLFMLFKLSTLLLRLFRLSSLLSLLDLLFTAPLPVLLTPLPVINHDNQLL